ncbi:hypothetical protein Tco_1149164 [Tanacetum coccineum]
MNDHLKAQQMMNDSMSKFRETFQTWLQQQQEQVVNLDTYTPEPSQCRKIPICYGDDDDEESSIPLRDIIISKLPPCIAITPVLSTEEPDNSLNASIIYSPKIDSLLEEFAGELTPIHPIPPGIHPEKDIRLIEQLLYDDTSSDDDSYEDIDYVDASPPYYELVSLEEVKDFHSEDGEIEDDILCEKLSKINLRIAKIEALNANPTPSSNFVLKSPIPVEDGYSFLEKFETTPELETFKFDIEEKNSGSTTIHADISLPDLECFYF